MKFALTLGILLIIQIFSISLVYGEIEHNSTKMEHTTSKDLSVLLKDEDESQFFTNQKSGGFHENFLRKATLSPPSNILIRSGTTITLTGILDREYSTVLIEGNLKIIDTGDSSFRVQKIIVGPTGSLTIGNEKNPIQDDKQVEIVFVNNKEGEVGIFVFGKLWIHGKEVNPTFVGIESYAKKWDKRIIVDTALKNWERDDTVVVTSLGNEQCNEISKIARIVNKDILLQTQLNCSHIGSNAENSLRSHVALLSRNVKITSNDELNRGSVNFFYESTGYVKYAQFDKLGPKEVLGRYPIHFHHLKDSSRGIEVIGNSITHSDNRWITIHDSNGIIVKNNVGYVSQGHGFFLEDGTEFDNVFEKNIGIITKKELIRSDEGSSIFWTMNPLNVYRNNVAVSAPYWGFLFAIPNEKVNLPSTAKQVNLRSLPSLEFEGNIAYNNVHGGLLIQRQIIEDEEISSSEIMISNFSEMSSIIKNNRNFGILISGTGVTVSNSSLLNNKIGIQFNGDGNKVMYTKIKMDNSFKVDTDISGIVIAGSNNLIENSEIKGYVSKNNNDASDISISNNQNNKRVLSAKIINTTLLDSIPFYFGNPANEKSYLEIYGYDAPFAQSRILHENFLLKTIGSDNITERGEYNNPDFDAMIKMIPEIKQKNQQIDKDKPQMTNNETTESELIKNFKNKSYAWGKNEISNKEFIDEIAILFDSRLIEINGVEQGYFKEIQFFVPQWIKKLVNFWYDNSISEQEFINVIQYILESQIVSYSSYD